MSSERGVPGSVFAELSALCLLCSSATHAATAMAPPSATLIEATGAAWIKYLWVLLIALLAWAASSLPVLAEWEGGGRRRLLIAQGVLQSVFFGFVAFWASTSAGQNLMAGYIAAAGAAYLGERHVVRARTSKDGGADAPRDHNGGGES